MSHREAEGGGQMGEAHWEVFLCVFSKPALLQPTGLLWHSTGFLSLERVHGPCLSLMAVALATSLATGQYNCTVFCVPSLALGGM